MPPPEELVELHRDGLAAELRGIDEIVRDAQLDAKRCCAVCEADEGLVVRISIELRAQHLPHLDCPRGFCRCHWVVPAKHIESIRKLGRRHARSEAAG